MGSSRSFASTANDIVALFRLGFPMAPALKALTEPLTVTRRIIMQKARRHTARRHGAPTACRHMVSDSLTPLAGVLFTFHSRYLVHYRSSESI
jgi:hypothetical protein